MDAGAPRDSTEYITERRRRRAQIGALLIAVAAAALAGCEQAAHQAAQDAGSVVTWAKSYGGPDDDSALAVAATAEGGFVFVGAADGRENDRLDTARYNDYWINKLDSNGNSEFARVIGPRNQISATTTFHRP